MRVQDEATGKDLEFHAEVIFLCASALNTAWIMLNSTSRRFPNGFGYGFSGADYLTGFALPNFFFHVTTAYAILRAAGVSLGKPDFLQHLGPPNLTA